MAVYAVGDIQGCVVALEELLDDLQFDPAKDQLWLTGDLVNRGSGSLESLRLVKGLGSAAITILGNHDLHLLSVVEGIKPLRPGDTLKKIITAPDRDELVAWLRNQPLAHFDESLKTLMVHAGVYPGWSAKKLKRRAAEVESVLRGPNQPYRTFLKEMYGRRPTVWKGSMQGNKRLRFITNACTRMRYVNIERQLDFEQKGAPGSQPKDLMPWFQHPSLKCRNWRIVCGHWSALGFWRDSKITALDSGCVWGGALTAVRLDGENQRQCWQVGCTVS